MNSNDKYGFIAKTLHWVIAVFIIGLIVAGLYMTDMEAGDDKWALYNLHKLFGIIVLGLIIFRIIWKILNKGKPVMLDSYSKIERIMAASVHGMLYIMMLVMPLSGWLMSSFGGYSVMLFGIDVMLPVEKDKDMGSIFSEIHHLGWYVFVALLALHIVGALKHHFIDKDDTLKRMLPECPLKCCEGCKK